MATFEFQFTVEVVYVVRLEADDLGEATERFRSAKHRAVELAVAELAVVCLLPDGSTQEVALTR